MAFRRNGHLEGVTEILNQLISVGWLGTGFMSGAELVKRDLPVGRLELGGIAAAGFQETPSVSSPLYACSSVYALVLLRNLSCATRAMSARNCLQATA
jgi:hypothetical protein